MKYFFLLAAIAGAIIPYVFFTGFFMNEGVALDTFITGLFANGAAAGFTSDVLISSTVFWVYLFHKKESGIWRYVLLNLTIGLSCALPYYLYVKTKAEQA